MSLLAPLHPDIILFDKDECHAMEVAAQYRSWQVIQFFSGIYIKEDISKVLGIFKNTVRLGFVPDFAGKKAVSIFSSLANLELVRLSKIKGDLKCGCSSEKHAVALSKVAAKLGKEQSN